VCKKATQWLWYRWLLPDKLVQQSQEPSLSLKFSKQGKKQMAGNVKRQTDVVDCFLWRSSVRLSIRCGGIRENEANKTTRENVVLKRKFGTDFAFS
jgi:hypothetical protein